MKNKQKSFREKPKRYKKVPKFLKVFLEKRKKFKELEKTLKLKIYNNKKFMRYKRLENETNILIMKLNKIFKELGDAYENN